MILVWQWTALILIALGSAAIIAGFIRTSFANSGSAKTVADAARRTWRKLTRWTPTIQTVTGRLDATVKIEAHIEVTHAQPDSEVPLAESLERLWKVVIDNELGSLEVHGRQNRERATDRAEWQQRAGTIEGSVAEVRSEMITRFSKQALDGLRLAAYGAVAVAAGDIIGGVLAITTS